jgi:hypothetical protein
MGLTKQQLTTMTNYRIELQAFVDAAASFTEPALGHHKAWAEAVARARVALSAPESSTNSVCPITPPLALINQWWDEAQQNAKYNEPIGPLVATQAARWGADQELDACCAWLPELPPWSADDLRRHRRPKPPSLKELALDILGYPKDFWSKEEVDIIRRALEQLPDDQS